MSSLVHLLAVVCTKRKPRDREREGKIGERDRTNSLQGNTKDEEILKHVTKLCQEMKWYAEAMSKQKESSSGYPN